MKKFNNLLEQIDIAKMNNYLEEQTSPAFESTLLKLAFEDLDIIQSGSLKLYRSHFVLFHFLYKLQEEYYKKGKYLHVHFMRTFLTDYPDDKSCRFYNEDNNTFCYQMTDNKSSYCSFHFKQLGELNIELISSKYFYLDIRNFYKLNQETAEEFVKGSWEILANYDEIKKSFKVLELPEKSTIDIVKKRYKHLAKMYHPDIMSNNIILAENQSFTEINNAYRLIIKLLSLKKKS